MRISLHAFVTLLAVLLLISFSNLASAACGAAPAASVDMALRFVGALHTWTKVDSLGTPTAGDVVYDTTGNVLSVCNGTSWQSLTAGGSASGSTGYVQFNNAGAFAADSALFWDNTNKRLGIGTASPIGVLTLSSSTPGNVAIYGLSTTAPSSNDSYTSLNAESFDGSTNAVGGTINFRATQTWTSAAHGTAIQFRVTPNGSTTLTEAMRIDNSGNVGIGTTSPGEILDIWNNANSTGYKVAGSVRVTNNAGGSNYSRLFLGQNATNAMFIEAADQVNAKGNLLLQPWGGNVGIGTTNPAQKLSVAGTIESTSGGIKFPDGTTQTTAASGGGSGTLCGLAIASGTSTACNSATYTSVQTCLGTDISSSCPSGYTQLSVKSGSIGSMGSTWYCLRFCAMN